MGQQTDRERVVDGWTDRQIDEMVFVFFCYAAVEAEQNFSEDDGWEFITLADQVSYPVYTRITVFCPHWLALVGNNHHSA